MKKNTLRKLSNAPPPPPGGLGGSYNPLPPLEQFPFRPETPPPHHWSFAPKPQNAYVRRCKQTSAPPHPPTSPALSMDGKAPAINWEHTRENRQKPNDQIIPISFHHCTAYCPCAIDQCGHTLHVYKGRNNFVGFPLWGNVCPTRARRATFRLCSPRRAPKHTRWKRP